MDANGQRFWMLTGLAHWQPRDNPPGVMEDAGRRTLRLASRRRPQQYPVNEAAAKLRRDAVEGVLDAFGTYASFESPKVLSTGALPGNVEILTLAAGQRLTGMAPGAEGVLYLAIDGAVRAHDLRERWPAYTRSIEGFKAWKLAPAAPSGVWVLGEDGSLARLLGEEQRQMPYGPYSPMTVRPCRENPHPPALEPSAAPPWNAAAPETPVDIDFHPEAGLALLSWGPAGEARVRLLSRDLHYSPYFVLEGVRFPFSLRWIDAARVAVLVPGVKEAPAFPIPPPSRQAPQSGEYYPLRAHDGAAFMRSPGIPPHYLSTTGPVPLRQLSLPSSANAGTVRNRAPIDSGTSDTVWHRIYLEASLPPHAGVRIWAAASESPDPETIAAADWHPHHFGEIAPDQPPLPGLPRGAWAPGGSEVAFHPGLLPCAPRAGQAGLFTVLLQRAGRRVRTLRGRYLHLCMRLHGDGLLSPEIAALRVYGSRFSYLNRYLPELYRETLFGEDADRPGAATGPDFLERFLDNCEGILTAMEDRIANAHLLTHPDTAPEEALEWLASWVGMTFDPAYPPTARRELLRLAPELYRRHGTLPGLLRALDVATGGAVRSGRIVVVEDFRLRRVFATILGAYLEDHDDPLTLGLVKSGNSFVGDTLFLGDENRREFLALFAAGLELSPSEAKTVQALFDNLAQRVTVLVHREMNPDLLGVIRRILQLEAPAHLLTRIAPASERFLAGIASLVGVDTWLDPKPEPRPVRTGVSYVGVEDYILQPPALDPRLESGLPPEPKGTPPVADAGPDRIVPPGEPFALDASRSHPGPGRTIESFRWRRIDH